MADRNDNKINHCIACGSEDIGGIWVLDRVPQVECNDCGVYFNIDDINGCLGIREK